MSVKERRILSIAIFLSINGLLVASLECYAELRRSDTWSAESRDGKFLFAMIPPISLEEELRQGNSKISDARSIRSRFQNSGLYELNELRPCLWTANFYLPGPGYVANDGHHVVILGRFANAAYPSFDDIIAYFVKDGSVISSPTYTELSSWWWIKRLVLKTDEIHTTDNGFNDENNTFWITTNLWETITFDATTGKVIGIRDPLGKSLAVSLVIFVIAATVFVWRHVRLRGTKAT